MCQVHLGGVLGVLYRAVSGSVNHVFDVSLALEQSEHFDEFDACAQSRGIRKRPLKHTGRNARSSEAWVVSAHGLPTQRNEAEGEGCRSEIPCQDGLVLQPRPGKANRGGGWLFRPRDAVEGA